MSYTVKEAAKISGVSVRTLHYYDEIGLLKPSGRSEANYRLYSAVDLERLQQVLFFRELDFPLKEVKRILDDPGYDRRGSLLQQRQWLVQKKSRTEGLIVAVDAALAALEKGTNMGKKELGSLFEGFDPSQYEAEVEQRWGESDAYRESARRTKQYTKNDWASVKQEGDEIAGRLAQLMEQGLTADSQQAVEIAEQHRQYICKWFYPCPKQMHTQLGQSYVDDPRFTANIDKVRAGLAQFWCDAIAANAKK